MRIKPTARRIYLAPTLGLVLVAAMSACSSSTSTSSSSAPASSASAAASSAAAAASSAPATTGTSGGSAATIAAITTNWNTFFNSATPNSKRVQLLQNGSEFSASISAFAASPLAAAVSSKVDSVTVDSATKATVKYDLTAAGATVATGATGSSVLQDGTWKVGDDVFCGLLTEAKAAGMSVPVPAACS